MVFTVNRFSNCFSFGISSVNVIFKWLLLLTNDRPSPDPTISQVVKKKDLKKSPQQGAAMRSDGQEEASVLQKIQSKKELKRQKKEMLSKQMTKELRPEPKQQKPRKSIRPDASSSG
ncbi:Protein of unknown function [Cotesia congregata]|uniref:Uncharacterized protein n=1 Tax=Cotesia congregata TaxID=51543 RepID=A0A8J2HAI1_COTCN|nr:Protein of unknown function [Cotesia congregata]